MGGEGQQGGGFDQFLGLALPFAALGAGLYRPQAGQAFVNLAQLSAQGQKQREDEVAQRAMAEQLSTLGFKTDPRLPASVQVALANAQAAQTREARVSAEEARTRAEEERQRGTMGQLSAVRARIGTELPTILQESLSGLAQQIGTSQEAQQAFSGAQKDIAESARRLATARAGGRPFETRERLSFEPLLSAAQTLGSERDPLAEMVGSELGAGQRLRAPSPLDVTRLPEGAQQLQEDIYRTGAVPSAETAAMQYGLPLAQLPGGAEAVRTQADAARKAAGESREAAKPPYAPNVHFERDAQGNVTRIVTRVDPKTGQTVSEPTALGRIGVPQERAASLNQAEILNSLAMVAKGQPQHALPEHRDLTPADANEVFAAIRQADRLPDPSLAATLLWGKVEKVREEIAKLEQDAQTANGDQARLRIETEITRRRVKLREYEGQLDFYIQAGSRPQGLRPVGAPPRAPQGAVQVGPDAQRAARLKAAGVVE